MKKPKVKKFCGDCGSKLEWRLIKRWDEFTGEQEKSRHCTNEKCERGCGFLGHVMGPDWILGDVTCGRCGYVWGAYR